MDAESLWLCQMDDAEKQIQPLREGVLKVKSWVLFTHCYQVCVKLLLHCPNQIRPREGSLRELLRALHVPSTFWGLLWGACNGTLCMWIPQGGGETLNKPSLLLFCPWGFPVSHQPLCWGHEHEVQFIPLCFLIPAWALWGTLNVQCLGKGLDLVQSHRKYLQTKESNNFSSYLNGSSNFLC